MYRDCIVLAIYSDWWDSASGPGVRGTTFKAIPQSIKKIKLIIILLHRSSDVFLLLFLPSFCSHAESTMNEVGDLLHGISRFLLPLLGLVIFQGLPFSLTLLFLASYI